MFPLGRHQFTAFAGTFTPLFRPTWKSISCLPSSSVLRRPTRMEAASFSSSDTSMLPSPAELLSRIDSPDYVNGMYAASPTTEWESVRLFGSAESDVRVVMYRDHASWCPYCQKVQLQLEAKRIPYSVRKENLTSYGKKSEAFLNLTPAQVVPVILLDGELHTESANIMRVLEQAFPERPMIISEDDQRNADFERFMALESSFSREYITVLSESPVDYTVTRTRFETRANELENALCEYPGPFFFGEEPSLADINLAPLFMRAVSSLKYFRNNDICVERPNCAEWLAAMTSWEASRQLMSDDLSYALPGKDVFKFSFLEPRGELSMDVENARARYVLDVGPSNSIPRAEAAHRLLIKFEDVLEDTCRGAEVCEEQKEYIRKALTGIIIVLMDADRSKYQDVLLLIPENHRSIVVTGLEFLRGRACTPRDMTLDGLIQFAGAINLGIDCMGHSA